MSFATLANENGITMLNGECAVDTGVMPQLTRKGMVVFCEQFGITYQERMENDFRIKIFINTYNAMIYKLYARKEDLKKYLPVEEMTYPDCGNNNDFRIARHQVSIVEVGKVKYTLGFDNRNKTVFVATGNIEEIISFIADNI